MKAGGIMQLLQARHPVDNGWAFFAELRERTGWDCRTMDAFAIHTWQSKGYRSVAYEVKVSRADFGKELEDPTKRAPAERLAGECYFAAPSGLLRVDEIPDGWGLIAVTKTGKMSVRKRARQRKPEPWPMEFVAMIARRSCDEERPSVPRVLLQYEGREVGAEDLREVAKKLCAADIREARWAGQKAGREGERGIDGDTRALAQAARSELGMYVTADELTAALTGASVVTDSAQRQLRLTLARLTRQLGALGVEAPTGERGVL